MEPGLRCLTVDRRESCLTTAAGQRYPLKDSLRRIADMDLQRGFFQAATFVVANSEYTASEIRRFSRTRNLTVIHPPLQDVTMAARAFTPGRLVVVGRLTRCKGIDHAIRALATLPGASLAVVGDGPDRASLEELATELGVGERTLFRGWLSQSEVMEQIQDAQVVLFPSLWPEPFGQVGLQAARCLRPVVAYDAGGVRAWLDATTGVLVPLGDWRALAQEAGALLAAPRRCQQLGLAARGALGRFLLPRFVDRIETAVRAAVAEHQGPS